MNEEEIKIYHEIKHVIEKIYVHEDQMVAIAKYVNCKLNSDKN